MISTNTTSGVGNFENWQGDEGAQSDRLVNAENRGAELAAAAITAPYVPGEPLRFVTAKRHHHQQDSEELLQTNITRQEADELLVSVVEAWSNIRYPGATVVTHNRRASYRAALSLTLRNIVAAVHTKPCVQTTCALYPPDFEP